MLPINFTTLIGDFASDAIVLEARRLFEKLSLIKFGSKKRNKNSTAAILVDV
jgi:hypothetical protein